MMILRVPVTDWSTRIVHYTYAVAQYICLVSLYNDQLRSVVKGHGINCDCDGWIWSD